MNFIRCNLFIAVILTSVTINAASFNCDLASTTVEDIICSNTDISKLDEELSVAYKNALKRDKASSRIKNEQRAWNKTRNQCADIECIRNEYKNRISELNTTTKKTSGSNTKCADRPQCWPEGSAMHTALILSKQEQDMQEKTQSKHEELIEIISIKKENNGKKYLVDNRLVNAVTAQHKGWEDFKDNECELIGALSGGAGNSWKSVRTVRCSLNLLTQRYKRLRDAVNCVDKIPLKSRQYDLQKCLYQIAPLAVPLEK